MSRDGRPPVPLCQVSILNFAVNFILLCLLSTPSLCSPLTLVRIVGKPWSFPESSPALDAPLGRIGALVSSKPGELIALDIDNQALIRLESGKATVLARAESYRPHSVTSDPENGRTELTALAIGPERAIYFATSTWHDARGWRSSVRRLPSNEPLFSVDDKIVSIAVGPDAAVYFSCFTEREIGKFIDRQITYFSHGANGNQSKEGFAIKHPSKLICNRKGTLFFIDDLGHRLAERSPEGYMRSLITTTWSTAVSVAELNREILGLAIDETDSLLASDVDGIVKVTGPGEMEEVARLPEAENLSSDGGGDIYVAPGPSRDSARQCYIYRINRGKPASIFAGNGKFKFGGDGGQALAATLHAPSGVAEGPDGSLYVVDAGNGVVRRVSPSGVISTWSPATLKYKLPYSAIGFPATDEKAPRVDRTCAMTVDRRGAVYIATREDPSIATDMKEELLVRKISPASAPQVAARFVGLQPTCGLTVANDSSLLIAVPWTGRVYRWAGGSVTPFAGNAESAFKGDLLDMPAKKADPGPAGLASLRSPNGLAADTIGNLYIAEGSANYRIRKVDSTGTIYTIAATGRAANANDAEPGPATVWSPRSLAVDGDGNLYTSDGSAEVQRIDQRGVVETIMDRDNARAGQPGEAASVFPEFVSLAIDHDGNILLADQARDGIYRLELHPHTVRLISSRPGVKQQQAPKKPLPR